MQLSKVERVALLAVLVAVIVVIGYWLRGSDPEPEAPLATMALPKPNAPAAKSSATSAPKAAPGVTCRKTLLGEEPILKRNGITLFMGHSAGEPGVRLPDQCKPQQLDAVFALSAQGIKALEVDTNPPSIVRVPWGCQVELPATRVRAAQAFEQDDMLVASGKNVKSVLKWTPAVQFESPVQCASPRPNYESEEQRLFQIAGFATRWYVESWRPEQDPLQPRQDTGTVPVPRVFTLGRLNESNECIKEDSAETSGSDSEIRAPGQYRRIYGVLRAKDSTEEKSWMILESGGDDARAVVAVQLDVRKLQLQPRSQDFWLYSGC